MRILAGAVALLFLLSGCMGGDKKFTCLDGTVVDLSTVSGSGDDGFDAQRDACTPPVPPAIAITAISGEVQAYHYGNVTWALLNGTAAGGHSMLNVIRLSHHPYSEAQMAELTDPNAYGIVELGKDEHQNLPAETTQQFSYNTVGTWYVRGLARIYDDSHNETIYWTPEVIVKVIPVQPTDQITTITHKAGLFVGGVDTLDVPLDLGDGVIFKNDDVTAHKFTFTSTPKNGTKSPVDVPMMDESGAIHFFVPGEYVVTTDDAQPITIRIVVRSPTA